MSKAEPTNPWISIKGDCPVCGEVIIIGMMDITKPILCLCKKGYLENVKEVSLD